MWCKLNCLQCSLLARCLPTRNSFNQKKCCMPTVNKEEYWVLWIGNESLLDMCKLTEHYTLNTAHKGRYARQPGVSRLFVWTGGFHHLFKTESARRWSNKWTKTLYQDYLRCIANFCRALLIIFSKQFISSNTKRRKRMLNFVWNT